eukprot:14140264-Alexandrium_andersonii.AAC.1
MPPLPLPRSAPRQPNWRLRRMLEPAVGGGVRGGGSPHGAEKGGCTNNTIAPSLESRLFARARAHARPLAQGSDACAGPGSDPIVGQQRPKE